MKQLLSKIFASMVVGRLYKDQRHAVSRQETLLQKLVEKALKTKFGIDHEFDLIDGPEAFKEHVPIRDYEALKSYIEEVRAGHPDILWPGKPIYLSKTSGTTSGAKYIPISSDSISNHINSARNALLCYIKETGKTAFVGGKMIFIQGSPELSVENGIKVGRLSGIVAHHVPNYLTANRMPSYETNCISDWEEKVDAIVDETSVEDMRLISGIPPWVQMYFEMLLEKSGKSNVAEVFPNISLLVFGGVNFKPYASVIEKLVGKRIDQIELYPASEGFIAFQDSQKSEGMLLNVNSGIFYEFIPVEELHNEKPRRLWLKEVELDVNYAVVITNNAGLWAYDIGDTVKFVSLDPFRIVVTGRIKHFTSAFGEHVISEEVEAAATHASREMGVELLEFHVAPVVEPEDGQLPHHEWLIEFNDDQPDLYKLEVTLDHYMQHRNPYYRDLREGNILEQLQITRIQSQGFNGYMKSIGKLGGQNKLPRLANDRKVADALLQFKYK